MIEGQSLSADGTLVVENGELRSVATGELVNSSPLKSLLFFGGVSVNQSRWSNDGHYLAQITDAAIYIHTDLPA